VRTRSICSERAAWLSSACCTPSSHLCTSGDRSPIKPSVNASVASASELCAAAVAGASVTAVLALEEEAAVDISSLLAVVAVAAEGAAPAPRMVPLQAARVRWCIPCSTFRISPSTRRWS